MVEGHRQEVIDFEYAEYYYFYTNLETDSGIIAFVQLLQKHLADHSSVLPIAEAEVQNEVIQQRMVVVQPEYSLVKTTAADYFDLQRSGFKERSICLVFSMNPHKVVLAMHRKGEDLVNDKDNVVREILSLGMILHVNALSAHDQVEEAEHYIFFYEVAPY